MAPTAAQGSLASEILNSQPKVTRGVRTAVLPSCLLIPHFSTMWCCQVEHHMPFRRDCPCRLAKLSFHVGLWGLCQLLKSGFPTLSDLPALPITRFTISQSAQWKSSPKNLNHSMKSILKIIIIRKGDNCHWDVFFFNLSCKNFSTEYKLCMTWDSGGKNLAGLGDFYSVFFLSTFLSILSVSTML